MNSNSDSIAQSDWCEVPLGTHGEQEVRHRSRYRKNGQTFSEQESVKSNGSENDVISTASGLMAGDKSEIKQSNESLAYHYGMKMLWGAAKAVSSVADGGKQNREVIKHLRSDLDQVNEENEYLQKELKNAKQWIVFYENAKGSLEHQLDQNRKDYSKNVNIMQEKIKKSESELNACRKELTEAYSSRDILLSNVQNAQASIEQLKLQVENEKKTRVLDGNVKMTHSAEEFKPTDTVAIQVQLDSISNSQHRALLELEEELEKKEKKLQCVVNALQVANSRGDKLRDQLMTSLNEVKSQTMVIGTIRNAHKSATSEMRVLKAELQDLKKVNETVLNDLNQEKKHRDELTKELQEKNGLLKEAIDTNTKLNGEIKKNESYIEIEKKTVKQLQTNLSLSKNDLFETKEKYQNEINDNKYLTQENSKLALDVKQISDKQVKPDASDQTNIESIDGKVPCCNMTAIQHQNESMAQVQFAENNTTAREQELLLQVEKLQEKVSTFIKEKNDLNDALSREREDSHRYYRHYIEEWEKYCEEIERQYQLKDWDICQLYKENLELRQDIMKLTSTYSCGYNKHTSYITYPYDRYFGTQTHFNNYRNVQQYVHDQGNSDKQSHAKLLETIMENEERLPENSIELSSLPNSVCSTPALSNNSSKTFSEVSLESVPSVKSSSSRNSSSSKRSSAKAHTPNNENFSTQNAATSVTRTQTDKTLNYNSLTLKIPQYSTQRLVGIPMPEDVFEQILAGENVDDWQTYATLDDEYSPNSSESIERRSFSHRNDGVIKTDESEIFASNNKKPSNYYVTYKDVEFDLVGLTVPKIRNIATACGAIGCQSEMNAFYDFLAAKTEEINKDEYWRKFTKLESPADWLSLKQEAFV